MKKVWRAVDVVSSVCILLTAFFVPLVQMDNEDGAELFSFWDVLRDYSFSAESVIWYFLGALFPAIIVLIIAIFYAALGKKSKVPAIAGMIISTIALLYTAVMLCFPVRSILSADYYRDSDEMGTITPAFLILVVVHVVSIISCLLGVICSDKFVHNRPVINNNIQRMPSQQVQRQASAPVQPMPSQHVQPQASAPVQPVKVHETDKDDEKTVSEAFGGLTSLPTNDAVHDKLQTNSNSSEVPPKKMPPLVHCISGEYEDASFPCDDTLIIGSNPMIANIVICGEKISENHCTISYSAESDTYSLIDCSLYGVYAEPPGSRLPAHIAIRLSRGTVISLGNEDNRFLLE